MAKWEKRDNKVKFLNTHQKIPDIQVTQKHALWGDPKVFTYKHDGFVWSQIEDPDHVLKQWEISQLTTELHKANHNLTMLHGTMYHINRRGPLGR